MIYVPGYKMKKSETLKWISSELAFEIFHVAVDVAAVVVVVVGSGLFNCGTLLSLIPHFPSPFFDSNCCWWCCCVVAASRRSFALPLLMSIFASIGIYWKFKILIVSNNYVFVPSTIFTEINLDHFNNNIINDNFLKCKFIKWLVTTTFVILWLMIRWKCLVGIFEHDFVDGWVQLKAKLKRNATIIEKGSTCRSYQSACYLTSIVEQSAAKQKK